MTIASLRASAGTDVARLLPGDRAPELRVARWFDGDGESGDGSASHSWLDLNGEAKTRSEADAATADPSACAMDATQSGALDRPTLVVLWNAACSACLPAIRDLAEIGATHGVPCYGVAVMVHDVATTERIARTNPSKARLALEERPHRPAAFSRGWVMRHWLEPSGVDGVPIAFAIDQHGVIARIGQPDEVGAILPDLLDNEWNVGAERRRWASIVSNDAVRAIRTRMDAMDLLVEGKASSALATIEDAERRWPAVMQERELSYMKLEALNANPGRGGEALAHYAWAAQRFGDEPHFQLRLASWVLARMPSEPALAIAIERLTALEDAEHLQHSDASKGLNRSDGTSIGERAQVDQLVRISLVLTLADALARSGRHREAVRRIERADALSRIEELPDQHGAWFASEIERLRQVAMRGNV